MRKVVITLAVVLLLPFSCCTLANVNSSWRLRSSVELLLSNAGVHVDGLWCWRPITTRQGLCVGSMTAADVATLVTAAGLESRPPYLAPSACRKRPPFTGNADTQYYGSPKYGSESLNEMLSGSSSAFGTFYLFFDPKSGSVCIDASHAYG